LAAPIQHRERIIFTDKIWIKVLNIFEYATAPGLSPLRERPLGWPEAAQGLAASFTRPRASAVALARAV
jgi:hypothetical protein